MRLVFTDGALCAAPGDAAAASTVAFSLASNRLCFVATHVSGRPADAAARNDAVQQLCTVTLHWWTSVVTDPLGPPSQHTPLEPKILDHPYVFFFGG